MKRELRLFLVAVGIPAILLMAAGARLVYVEWRFNSRVNEMRELEKNLDKLPPPPDFGLPPPEGGMEFNHDGIEPPDRFPPLPKPPMVFRMFSEKYCMNGPRDLTIIGCLAGLMLLSLVSGSWLLMRDAKKARLEALQQTDFVSNISHEFKTPLTTICLCAELAQDDGLDHERRKKALVAILSESERLKRLVLNALDFSRLEKNRHRYNMRTVDVAEIAREVCETFSPRFGDGQVSEPVGNRMANADDEAVRQILVNLLDNAAKYAPNGTVEVSVTGDEHRVQISVADRGPGLSPDELRHAFDRFWRGDESVTRETGGNGLGLAIARGLARGMGGDLTAANRKDGGAVFTLELKA